MHTLVQRVYTLNMLCAHACSAIYWSHTHQCQVVPGGGILCVSNWFTTHWLDCQKKHRKRTPICSDIQTAQCHWPWASGAANVHVRTCSALQGRYTKTTGKLMLHVCCAVAAGCKWIMMLQGTWLRSSILATEHKTNISRKWTQTWNCHGCQSRSCKCVSNELRVTHEPQA